MSFSKLKALIETTDIVVAPTETPAFKAWFKNSVVVNPDGSPKVCYHGTSKEFSRFDNKFSTQGVFWFSDSKEYITGGTSGALSSKVVMPVYLSIQNPAGWDEYDRYSLFEIEHQGFDGIILDECYIVFEPTQIKSVNNNGKFNPSRKSIYEEVTPSQEIADINTPIFKGWFKNSKVVDEKGMPLIMYHGTPNAGFNVFNDNSHFTSNKEYADIYQNKGASSIQYKKTADNPDTYLVYLSIQNPFDARDEKARSIFLHEYQAYYSPQLTDRGMIDWLEVDDLKEWLKENHPDYDGIIADEGGVGGYGDEVKHRGFAYVPFFPTQIKSIYNNGNFSPTLANIYEMCK